MIALLQNDLDVAKRKLQFYNELKAKNPSKKASPADRWIEIYDERVHKLEKQIAKAQAQLAAQAHAAEEAVTATQKPGLKTSVSSSAKSRKRA